MTPPSTTATTPAPTKAATTAREAQDLRFLREEEKLARDVYRFLYEKWQLRPFRNISGAEQRHMNRIGAILKARNLPDPVVDDSRGVFGDATLRKLYSDLTRQGSSSLVAALRVGAHVEELDIFDIQRMRAHTRDATIKLAYDVLECGSRNHLRAYMRNLRQRGETYTPQHLSQQQVDAILAGDHERCGQIYGAQNGDCQHNHGEMGRRGRRGQPGQRGRRGGRGGRGGRGPGR